MYTYFKSLYGLKDDDRVFPITKSYLHHELNRGSKAAGVKRIRIHDLRHSHVSLLIEKGFSALAIAKRVGHESIRITYKYAHLFPSKGVEIANSLNDELEVLEYMLQIIIAIKKHRLKWKWSHANESMFKLRFKICSI